MAENSGISWTHHTQNFWVGCTKIAAGCKHCYIHRDIRKQTDPYTGEKRKSWGQLYRTDTWDDPLEWEKDCIKTGRAMRVFTNSLADFFFEQEVSPSPFDFFHNNPDVWRAQAWEIIKNTPHLNWLVLTKRPELIEAALPKDWGNGYENVWLGYSCCCKDDLQKMDILRDIPAAVRWLSCEPLLEDIAAEINLDKFGWVVCGGESGSGAEYMHGQKPPENAGRRTMRYRWAANLRDKVKARTPEYPQGRPFMFKQVTSPRSGFGYNALDGVDWHQFPDRPAIAGCTGWAPRQAIPEKYKMDAQQIACFKQGFKHPFIDTRPLMKPKRIGTQKRDFLLDRLARGGNQTAAKELLALEAEARAKADLAKLPAANQPKKKTKKAGRQ